MFSRIRKRFTFANVVVVFALVFAMTGGAYAASRYVITSTKQISPKVLKQLQGKTGAKGDAGASGAAGSIGSQGPIGPAGPNGKNGENGVSGEPGEPGQNGKSILGSSFTGGAEPAAKPCNSNGGYTLEREDSGVTEYVCDGKIGKSVVVAAATSGASGECEEGGATVETEGEATTKKAVCNGKNGANGEPWTPNSKLPNNATETGGWAVGEGSAGENLEGPISFTVPLETALASSNVVHELVGYSGTAGTECPGSVAKPEAKAGYLCVYIGREKGIVSVLSKPTMAIYKLEEEVNGASTAGARIKAKTVEGERSKAYMSGTWAVTAP